MFKTYNREDAMQSLKLSRKTKIIYGAGDLGFSLTSTIIGAYFLFFLTDVVQLKPAVAGIAIFIGKTWDWKNEESYTFIKDMKQIEKNLKTGQLLYKAAKPGH